MKTCVTYKGYRHFLLTVADALLSTFVFFPLTVLHWEGTWVLQDEYFFPENSKASTLLSLALGAIVCTLQLLMQPQLAQWLLKQPPVLYFVTTRLHLYLHGWAILCYWRGVWDLLDCFFNLDHPLFHHIVLGVYFFCQLLMVLFRTVRTTIGPPVSIKLDFCDDLLEADLIFKVHHMNPLWFVLDCLFTQFVIVTLSLTIWWALWWFYDLVLFPDPSSDSLCLFIGFCISISFLTLEAPLAWVSQQLDDKFWWKVAYEDIIFITLTWANLMFWRGFWNVWVTDFIDRKYVGVWFSHVIGTLGLFALQSLNSTGQHGIDRDGSYEGGTGIFPNKFLTIVFQKQLNEDIQYERVQTAEAGSIEGASKGSKESSLSSSVDATEAVTDDKKGLLTHEPTIHATESSDNMAFSDITMVSLDSVPNNTHIRATSAAQATHATSATTSHHHNVSNNISISNINNPPENVYLADSSINSNNISTPNT